MVSKLFCVFLFMTCGPLYYSRPSLLEVGVEYADETTCNTTGVV
jgi:hypothetical protein